MEFTKEGNYRLKGHFNTGNGCGYFNRYMVEDAVNKRFYIDKRHGIIAVKDSEKKHETNGLHGDNSEVVAHWIGHSEKDEHGFICWRLYDWQIEKANKLFDLLNNR